MYLARDAGWMRLIDTRLVKYLSFTTATAIATSLLGLRLSDRLLSPVLTSEDDEPTKAIMPALLKYDVIFLIKGHHLFLRVGTHLSLNALCFIILCL